MAAPGHQAYTNSASFRGNFDRDIHVDTGIFNRINAQSARISNISGVTTITGINLVQRATITTLKNPQTTTLTASDLSHYLIMYQPLAPAPIAYTLDTAANIAAAFGITSVGDTIFFSLSNDDNANSITVAVAAGNTYASNFSPYTIGSGSSHLFAIVFDAVGAVPTYVLWPVARR